MYHSIVSGTVPLIPYPSLAAKLRPELQDMGNFLEAAAAEVDPISLWDGTATNHEQLLVSLKEISGKIVEWKTAIRNKLLGLWMSSSAEYNAYRSKINRALRKRHYAEVTFLFPQLVNAERSVDLDHATLLMMPEEERGVRQHLGALGLGYDRSLEGPSLRITALIRKQMKERSVFDTTSHAHGEQLIAAKKNDFALLDKEIAKVESTLTHLTSSVEGKITAATKMGTYALYHKPGGVTMPTPPSQAKGARRNISHHS